MMVLGTPKFIQMNKKREHAERNQELAIKLLEEGKFFDWVVTSSFYSSIHLVEDRILPTMINGQTCSNINDVRKAYKSRGRHPARTMLVEEFLAGIAYKYNWLDDQSRNSRYTTYKVSKQIAEKSIVYLKSIFEAKEKSL